MIVAIFVRAPFIIIPNYSEIQVFVKDFTKFSLHGCGFIVIEEPGIFDTANKAVDPVLLGTENLSDAWKKLPVIA